MYRYRGSQIENQMTIKFKMNENSSEIQSSNSDANSRKDLSSITAVRPPSTSSLEPVTNEASSLIRNAYRTCNFLRYPNTPKRVDRFDVTAVSRRKLFTCSRDFNLPRVDCVNPDTEWAKFEANARVMPLIPAFTVLYGKIPAVVRNA